MRDLARAMRYAPDRLLHPRRRGAAERRLEALRPRSVLVVCRGNLCRSPYAAERLRATLRAAAADHLAIHSAGFLAPGQQPPGNAVVAAGQLGVDLATHQSRQLSRDLIREVDLVLVMEPEQARAIRSVGNGSTATTMLLGDFDPEPVSTRAIPDPYGGSLATFLACYRQIDRCVAAVALRLGGSGLTARARV